MAVNLFSKDNSVNDDFQSEHNHQIERKKKLGGKFIPLILFISTAFFCSNLGWKI